MYALFFDSDRIIASIPEPEHSQRSGVSGVHLLNDNEPAYRSTVVLDYLTE